MKNLGRQAYCFMALILMHASSAYAVTYDMVTVGNPGNAPDKTSFGSVNYIYQIGKYEVTVAHYTEFLNAVAKTDTYELWNNSMQAAASVAGITRSGSQGSYTYTAMTGTSGQSTYSQGGTPPFKTTTGIDSSHFPITYVSWFNAARFANWMSNGQPEGLQNGATTENGAYNINGATKSGIAPGKNDINPNTGGPPNFFIPTENEWYKAAYFDQSLNNGRGGYYRYATRSNNFPGNVLPHSGYASPQPLNNQSNYIYGTAYLYCVTQNAAINTTQYYLSDVGSFAQTYSPYGAFDMNGNVWELNSGTGETSPNVGIRGGAWTSLASYLRSAYYLGTVPYSTASNVGFRLAGPSR
jgi:sulfatase modifying factor 1